jgi:hypothetical protein
MSLCYTFGMKTSAIRQFISEHPVTTAAIAVGLITSLVVAALGISQGITHHHCAVKGLSAIDLTGIIGGTLTGTIFFGGYAAWGIQRLYHEYRIAHPKPRQERVRSIPEKTSSPLIMSPAILGITSPRPATPEFPDLFSDIVSVDSVVVSEPLVPPHVPIPVPQKTSAPIWIPGAASSKPVGFVISPYENPLE